MNDNVKCAEDVKNLNAKQLSKLLSANGISARGTNKAAKINRLCEKLGFSPIDDATDFQKVLQSVKTAKKGWTKNIRQVPNISIASVTDYLIRAHDTMVRTESGDVEDWTGATMVRYKTLRSHRLYEAGHIHSMECLSLTESNFCAVRALCNPSWDTSGTMYNAIVVLDKRKDKPVGSSCTCVVGPGEACTHTAAILWALEDFTSRGYHALPDDPASTEILCKWTAKVDPKVEAVPLSQVTIKKSVPSATRETRKRKALHIFDPVEESKRKVDVERLHKLVHNLNLIRPTLPFLAIADPGKFGMLETTEATKTPHAAPSLPPKLPYKAEELVPACDLSVETSERKPLNILDKAKLLVTSHVRRPADLVQEFVSSLTVAPPEDRATIDQDTLGQACNEKWHYYRKGVITGTTIRSVHTKMNTLQRTGKGDTYKLVRRILGSENRQVTTDAVRYGRSHEKDALKVYKKKMKILHRGFQVEDHGLLLHGKYSFIGCSPDAVARCECHPPRIVEIKCPITLRDADSIQTSYIMADGTLKEKHVYYGQVQCNMAVFGIGSADFVVWCPKDLKIIEVPFDMQHWAALLSTSVTFFTEHLAQAILDQADPKQAFVSCPSVRNVVKDKICSRCNDVLKEENDIVNNDDASVQCDCECGCGKWYHWNCTNYQQELDAMEGEDIEWYCPGCVWNCGAS